VQVNRGVGAVQRVQTQAGEAQLKGLIEKHLELTGSTRAKAILDTWQESLPRFWQLVPPSEKQTPEASNLLSPVLDGPVTVGGGAPKAPANGQKVPANGRMRTCLRLPDLAAIAGFSCRGRGCRFACGCLIWPRLQVCLRVPDLAAAAGLSAGA
jgi:hypothetical protein